MYLFFPARFVKADVAMQYCGVGPVRSAGAIKLLKYNVLFDKET
jgi:hypothetical protein